MTKQPHVWIVEMLNPETRKWEPTTGTALNRDEARIEQCEWVEHNYSDEFRIRQYVRRP